MSANCLPGCPLPIHLSSLPWLVVASFFVAPHPPPPVIFTTRRLILSPLNDPPPPVCKLLPSRWPLVHQLVVGCHVTPVVAPLPPLVLSARCLHLSSSRHAVCLATSRLRLATCHRLLSPGTSPLVCPSFDDWFSHIISSRRRLKCPSSTPAFIHTGWLLRLISSRCFHLPSSHQHRRLLMRWLLTSHPVFLSFAPTSCLCV